MAVVSDVEAVLNFLRRNGLTDAETALKQDIVNQRGDLVLGSYDFEKFEFPMSPRPPPPVRIGLDHLQFDDSESCSDSSSDFLSMASFDTDGFTNPYGIRTGARIKSEASSADFGTARDYHDSDINDMYWYDGSDNDYLKHSDLERSGFLTFSSEDKFVTTSEEEGRRYEEPQSGLNFVSEGFHSETSFTCLDKSCLLSNTTIDYEDGFKLKDSCQWDETIQPEQDPEAGLERHQIFLDCSVPLCNCCIRKECHGKLENCHQLNSLKELNWSSTQPRPHLEVPFDSDFTLEDNSHGNFTTFGNKLLTNNLGEEELQQEFDFHLMMTEDSSLPCGDDKHERDGKEAVQESPNLVTAGDGEECNSPNELRMYENHEDEYEVFNLRIVHRKNRTGFEANKDLPIVLSTIIAGRYYVTEYLGSATFSKVVQAHDLNTGVDVCLKIIKNDKDFFDQSLDEIKLLKFVNKHDPADENHILRLYDYFYHQEHLFIVCELLRANLYEFMKYNQESGGEAYFTLSKLQIVTRQCLEALEYLHHLGIIHCDLKPENILIKSYNRCEIKVIDLGSSCFQTDNLCLYAQSRSYRAPEVILGLSYDQRIDIWSLGCILAELCSGNVLFPNDSVVILLARMIGMLGPIDMEMLVKGHETHKYFTKDYEYLYYMNEETSELVYLKPEESSLENHLKVYDIDFTEFIKYLLEVNPRRRPTATEALRHPWLSHRYN